MKKMIDGLSLERRLVGNPSPLEVAAMFETAEASLELSQRTAGSRNRRIGQILWTTAATELRKRI
jgi:hypothetical protein